MLGAKDGHTDGFLEVGSQVGEIDGTKVGADDGEIEGVKVGNKVGI